MTDRPEPDEVADRTVAALRDWEQSLDAVQRARLAAARRRALATRERVAWPLWGGAALAASLALALGLGFWPRPASPPPLDGALLQATLEADDFNPADGHAEVLLDDDVELYLWLDGAAEST